MTSRFATILAPAILAAQVGPLFGAAPAAAKPAMLTPEQISTFQSKLSQARTTQKTLGDREICFNNYIEELRSRSHDRERALGEIRPVVGIDERGLVVHYHGPDEYAREDHWVMADGGQKVWKKK